MWEYLGENFFGYDGAFSGWIKFYFPKAPLPSRENFLGKNFFGHDGIFPGQIKFYFPKAPPPHGRISLVRISLLTTAYSLVQSNFILQRPPPHARIALVRISLVTTAYSLLESNFIFQRPPPSREKFLGENFFGHDGVLHGRFKSYFPKVPHPHGRIFLWEFFLVTMAYSPV